MISTEQTPEVTRAFLTRASLTQEMLALEAEIKRRRATPAGMVACAIQLEQSIPEKARPLLLPCRKKGMKGGRGGTKSHTFGRMLLAQCLQHPGTRALCLREIQLSLQQSVKKLLEDLINEYDLPNFRILDTRIDAPGNGVIIFQGMQSHTSDSIKSLEGFKFAWVEEAHTVSKRSLDLLIPTIRSEGSELWFSWNPEKPTDPVEQEFSDLNDPDAVCIEMGWADNPHFPEVLRLEMLKAYRRDPETAAHVWGGKHIRKGKLSVFKNWRVDAFDTPARAMFLFGADWGFSIDPSVLVRMFVAEGTFRDGLILKYRLEDDAEVLCIDAESYRVGCEVDDTPELFDTLDPAKFQMARQWKIKADSARPETISYMQKHGYPLLEPARKGPGSVEEGIKFLERYDVVIHTRCVHTADEFGNYSYKAHPLTGDPTPVLEDKKNHVIDSVRYAVEDLHHSPQRLTW